MPITPETKLGDFLDAHPDLQEALIARVPEFAKLRNPILRRTVAKLATVDQAARIAGIPTAELVTFLRRLAGESAEYEIERSAVPAETPRPSWTQVDRVRATLEAEALLAGGEHPLAQVRRTLAQVASGDAILLKSAFRPEPLLDLLNQESVPCWCGKTGEGAFETWILKA
jgi:hypothetical protein